MNILHSSGSSRLRNIKINQHLIKDEYFNFGAAVRAARSARKRRKPVHVRSASFRHQDTFFFFLLPVRRQLDAEHS